MLSKSDVGTVGNLQEFKENEKFLFDTKKKSEMLKDETETNGYNLIKEPPKMMTKPAEKFSKEEISVQRGKKASEQIKSLVKSEEQPVTGEGLKNLNALGGSIAALSAYFDEEIPMPEKDKDKMITKEALAKNREDMDASCTVISFMYNKLVNDIDICLKNDHGETDGENLRQTLGALKKQCEKERETFKDKALQYQSLFIKDKKRAGEKPKWVDVLEFARGEYFDLEKSDYILVKNIGGASSEIFEMKNKADEESLWFCKDIKVPTEDKEQMMKEIFEDTASLEISEETLNALKEVFDDMYVKTDSSMLYRAFASGLNYRGDDFFKLMKEKLASKEGEDENKAFKLINNLNENDKESVYEIIDLFVKREINKWNAYKNKASAKIEPGSSLSKRNVATSRMAYLLGVQNIVCDARTAYVKDQDKVYKGTIMEDAGGYGTMEISNIAKDLGISLNALSQMFMLQALDAICGQTDRHFGNMNVMIAGFICIDSIRAFDNNMSFGNTTMKDMRTINYHNVKPISKNVIAALPTGLVNRIFNIQRPVLNHMFADLLSQSEIEALWKRIHDFQKIIADCFKYDMKARDEQAKKNGFYKDVYLKYEGDLADDNFRLLQSIKKMSDDDTLKYTNLPKFLTPSKEEIDSAAKDKNTEYLDCPNRRERYEILRSVKEEHNK